MHIACKCLNVSINSRSVKLNDVDLEDIQLTPSEQMDPFFEEVIASVNDLEGITKEQPGLMETSSEELDNLKSSPNYSPVFRVIIDHSTLDDADLLQLPSKYSVSQLPNSRQLALASLQQQLEEAIQKEATSTEEKIRNYALEQYQILEKFRDRSHLDHRVLARQVCDRKEAEKPSDNSSRENLTNDSNLVTSSFNETPQVTLSNDMMVVNGSDLKSQIVSKQIANDRRVSKPVHKKELSRVPMASSYDAEALFPLEGMDEGFSADNLPNVDSESDTDAIPEMEQDEGVRIPRGQRGHSMLAKSLPVTVPAFSATRRAMLDEDDDQMSEDPLDPHNIRASIKALAKSVHGDTVFGDLPRPRFSTLI